MTNRRSEFTAQHLRQPTAEEARELAELERQDRRQAEADRREREVRAAYLRANPGASEDDWHAEKAELLKADRRERTLREKAAATALYRTF